MKRTNAILAATLVVVALGLVTMPLSAVAQEDGDSMEVEATITEDGEFETLRMVWETDAQTYSSLESTASEQGYDTVAAWFAEEELIPDENGYAGYENADDTELEDGYAIEMEFTDFNQEEFDDTELTAENGTVSMQIGNVEEPEADETFSEMTYVINMPGAVTDSNALTVDGSTATWHLHEERPNVLSVESETGSDTASDSDSTDDDGIPGFGVGASVVGLLLAVLALGYRHD